MLFGVPFSLDEFTMYLALAVVETQHRFDHECTELDRALGQLRLG